MGRAAIAADRLPSQRKRATPAEIEQEQQQQQAIEEQYHARKKINQEESARARVDRLEKENTDLKEQLAA
eukprot:2447328-Prymnesium_polylepis.1